MIVFLYKEFQHTLYIYDTVNMYIQLKHKRNKKRIKCTLGPTCASTARWIRVRVRVSVRVLFRQTLDEWMGPKVHFFPKDN